MSFLKIARQRVYLTNFQSINIIFTAEYQSQLLQKLRQDEAFVLTSREEQILTRGRNAASQRNHNRRDPGIYQDATALEALVGYLYICDPNGRCSELFDWIEAAHAEFEVSLLHHGPILQRKESDSHFRAYRPRAKSSGYML